MKNIKLYLLFAYLLSTVSGCKKFVELEAPSTLLLTSNVFQRDETVNAAITGLYGQIINNRLPGYIATGAGLSVDELSTTSAQQTDAFQNALQAQNASTNDVWRSGFSYIYQANALYEGCAASSTISPAVKKQVMAEARFIRAFANFYLVNLYGDIPLITTTNYSINATLDRSPASEIYALIISDLKYAQENLNENYVAGNSISTSTDRVRPNKAAATALLARVYLYTRQYVDAEAQASAVIAQGTVYTLVGLGEVFLKNNKEAIWQLAITTPNAYNTVEGSFFILTAPPPTGGFKSYTVSQQLLNAFDSIDKRKSNWIGTYTNTAVTPNVNYLFPYKYKVDNVVQVTEASTVIRLAELLLIRSEARAQQNKLSDAVTDIDMIRQRAGIPLISAANPSISQVDLLAVILKERQRELFTEWGHRWLDLKRTGTIDAVMTSVAPTKNSTWATFKALWPVPQKDIGNNPNLKQNAGYN